MMRTALLVVVVLAACGKSADPPKPADPWASGTPNSNPAPTPSAPSGPSAPDPVAISGPFVGRWATSHSDWDMTVAGTKGSEVHEYTISGDGTYSYRREGRSTARGDVVLTVAESGTATVDGDRITLTPRDLQGAIKNRDGSVVETVTLAPETVTYTWQLHRFEGIQETQLVLTPVAPAATTIRDGAFASNDLFPTSYLLSAKYQPEWVLN